jgi:hypothetical protein
MTHQWHKQTVPIHAGNNDASKLRANTLDTIKKKKKETPLGQDYLLTKHPEIFKLLL